MTGRVYLVGAGPGDPGLLTARALELIARADVILYDRLIPPQALEGARADAELLFVGKEGGGESVPQEQTETLLIERARAGRSVVRLKGGDPFVFGRGGEEALTLRAAGIPFEVVPGITAGVAAAAYAGIPVTHRGLATAVALVTGHTRADAGRHMREPAEARTAAEEPETAIDWSALAAFPGTLVFYMAVRQLPHIAAALIAAGRPAGEPVAIIERGTLPAQRTIAATLATIAERARAEEVKAPAITVVGAVAELAEQIAWQPPRPLRGRTVAVTRARAQASGLALTLSELGARVVQAPTIRVEPLAQNAPAVAPELSGYDLLCLTSANGVTALFQRLAAAGLDARALAGVRVAAIGSGTASALAEHGIAADIVPARAVAEGLVEALVEIPLRRVLLATARGARTALPAALRARGAAVDVLELYETVAEPLPATVLQTARTADYVTFTSASTVRFLVQSAARAAPAGAGAEEPLLSPTTRTVSIGPITSAALREHGLPVHVEAERHDVDGLVQALLADAAAQS
jgi:uroporphyrinogen III methyltransferase / synthase